MTTVSEVQKKKMMTLPAIAVDLLPILERFPGVRVLPHRIGSLPDEESSEGP